MIAARAVHFAATAMTVGSIFFGIFIAKPVLQHHAPAAISFKRRIRPFIWSCLLLAVISGAIWLLLQTASMSGIPLIEALTADMLSTVIDETQFGEVTTIRAGLAVCLSVCLVYDRAVVVQWIGLATAAGFVSSLAWTGHAGSTVGAAGYLHLAADVLHLVTAAAWIGGLASLVIFLSTTKVRDDMSLVRNAVRRFSTLGIVSVTILFLSGIVNTAILVGSLHGLLATEYGRLLTLKLAMFVLMLAFAAINRLGLAPRLAPSGNQQLPTALYQLIRNSVIEIMFGLAILATVGVLGMQHPPVHLVELTNSW